jgi:hypothetical protein
VPRFDAPIFRSTRRVAGATAVVAVGAAAALASPVLSGADGVASAELVSHDAPIAHVSHQGAPEDLAGAHVTMGFAPIAPAPPVAATQVAAPLSAPSGTINSSERASRSSTRQSLPATRSTSGSPKQIAQTELAARGWSGQFGCLNSLWSKESGWKASAANPSGAYGIPQALPGSKMASAGADWKTNPATQIAWGLSYIADTYGTPCAAWSHSQADNWY